MTRKVEHPPIALPVMIGRFSLDIKPGSSSGKQWTCSLADKGWHYRFVVRPILPLDPQISYFFLPKQLLATDEQRKFRVVRVFILRDLAIPAKNGRYRLDFRLCYDGRWEASGRSDDLAVRFVVSNHSPNLPSDQFPVWKCSTDKVLVYNGPEGWAIVSVKLLEAD